MLTRSMPLELRAADGQEGRFEVSASSEFPVRRGRYMEVLDHSPGAMRSIAASALFNHNPDWLIGGVRACDLHGKQTRASIEIAPDAKLPSGVSALEAIKRGDLTGISIGYSIDSYERAEVDGQVQIRATAWTIREISFTPIPADPTVGVGRSEDDETFVRQIEAQDAITPPAAPATKERSAMSEQTKTEPQVPAVAPPTPDLASLARELGVDAKQAILDAVARKAQPAPVSIEVRADEKDKIRDEAVDAVLAGRSVHDVARRFASRSGLRGVAEWGKRESTDFILSRAVEDSNNFNNVTILAANKSMIGGYNSYTPWSEPLVAKMTASDFKTVRVAGLQTGDFSEPGEGSAFSDLTIDDNLTGSGALTFRGAGLELTKEAIYNDELGLFMAKLAQVGLMAARHQDIKVAAAIEAASFANASLGTGALAAGTLPTAWKNFVSFTGPAGQKLGVLPRYLVVPPALWHTAASLLTLAQGGAATAGVVGTATPIGGASPFAAPMIPVVGLHLSSATAYYMAAEPMQAGGFTVVKHVDYPTPKVFEVDAGLVASRKFRIEYPMAVITATSATGKPVGWGKSAGT